MTLDLSQPSNVKSKKIEVFWDLKKSLADTMENTILRKVDTWLKLPMQKIFLAMFPYYTGDFWSFPN